jgi:predicted RNA-binding protein with PIN domain
MASFDFTGERILIVDGYNQRVDLNPQEGLDLLHWLSDNRDAMLSLTYQGAQQEQSREKRLEIEIRLYQEDLEHLDKLRAAIPSLHESRSAVKVFDAQLDPVTERAIQLLKELQLEYKIHPLLEDNDAFAQG